MNKRKSVLIVTVLAAILSGCSATAAPAVVPTEPSQTTTSPTELAVPSSEATEPAVETLPGFTDIQVRWEDNPLLAMLPNPKEGIVWFQYKENLAEGSVRIVSNALRPEEIKEYIQILQGEGYVLDAPPSEIQQGRTDYFFAVGYSLKNQQDVYIEFNAMLDSGSGENGVWISYFDLYTLPDETVPKDAVPNSLEWAADPLRALVPCPPTEYWTLADVGLSDIEEYVGVHLQYTSMAQVQAYAQELQKAGFSVNTEESHSAARYSFFGQDAMGNIVELRYVSTAEKRATLCIYPKASLQEPTWTFFEYKNRYFPEPPDGWHIQSHYGRLEYFLYGMDYQDALEYMDEAEQLAKTMGNECVIKISQQEDEAQKLSCSIELYAQEMGQLPTRLCAWKLYYDAADTQCPFKLTR